MKKQSKSLFIVMLACMAIACSQNRKEADYEVSQSPAVEMSENQITESIAYEEANDALKMTEVASSETKSAPLSSAAAVATNNDPSRKFLRTADIRCKVKNVIQSTYNIEDIAVRNGGFVTNSDLTSQIYSSDEINISEDSALLVTRYVTSCVITLRVPNHNLDATLKEIAPLVDYLDFRQIKADDVALQMLSNKYTQQRLDRNQQRLENAIDNRGRRLEETTTAEELLLNAQERADQAKIASLGLADRVSFSTVTINIYQNQSIKKEMVERQKEIKAYKTGLGTRLKEALSGGWDLICYIIIAISYMWGLILAAILIFIGFRFYKKYKQDSN